jgi:hypothetical protein
MLIIIQLQFQIQYLYKETRRPGMEERRYSELFFLVSWPPDKKNDVPLRGSVVMPVLIAAAALRSLVSIVLIAIGRVQLGILRALAAKQPESRCQFCALLRHIESRNLRQLPKPQRAKFARILRAGKTIGGGRRRSDIHTQPIIPDDRPIHGAAFYCALLLPGEDAANSRMFGHIRSSEGERLEHNAATSA